MSYTSIRGMGGEGWIGERGGVGNLLSGLFRDGELALSYCGIRHAAESSKRPRSNEVGYAGQQRDHSSTMGHAFQAVYPGQASHSPQVRFSSLHIQGGFRSHACFLHVFLTCCIYDIVLYVSYAMCYLKVLSQVSWFASYCQ